MVVDSNKVPDPSPNVVMDEDAAMLYHIKLQPMCHLLFHHLCQPRAMGSMLIMEGIHKIRC